MSDDVCPMCHCSRRDEEVEELYRRLEAMGTAVDALFASTVKTNTNLYAGGGPWNMVTKKALEALRIARGAHREGR